MTKQAQVEEEMGAHLEALNRMVFGEESRIQLEWVKWDDVREQDVNANSMPATMFNALVANVRKAGGLESVPLIANRAGSDVLELVSGHHRVRADRQAGHAGGLALRYRDLTASEIRAKQLAHNSIAGASDPQLVLEIYSQITDLEAQMESYINPADLGKMPAPVHFEQIDIDPEAELRTATLVFLPTQEADFKAALDAIGLGRPDVVYLASRQYFDDFLEALHRTRRELEVYSVPAAVAVMAELVLQQLDGINREKLLEDVQARQENRKRQKGWIPFTTLLGSDRVPPDAAKKINQAVEKLAGAEKLKHDDRWKALLKWAEEYIAD